MKWLVYVPTVNKYEEFNGFKILMFLERAHAKSYKRKFGIK